MPLLYAQLACRLSVQVGPLKIDLGGVSSVSYIAASNTPYVHVYIVYHKPKKALSEFWLTSRFLQIALYLLVKQKENWHQIIYHLGLYSVHPFVI